MPGAVQAGAMGPIYHFNTARMIPLENICTATGRAGLGRLLIVSVLVIVAGMPVYGQATTFYKIYTLPGRQFVNAVFERSDGNYLAVATSFEDAANKPGIMLLLADTGGEMIWARELALSGVMQSASSALALSGNSCLIGGYRDDFATLFWVGADGELLRYRSYPELKGWMSSLRRLEDGRLLFAMSTDTASTVVLADSTGALLMTRSYGWGYINAVAPAGDGFAIFGTDSVNAGMSDMVYLLTDSSGEVYKQSSFGAEEWWSDYAYCMEALPGGGHILAGLFDQQVLDWPADTYFIRMDASGDTLWTNPNPMGAPQALRVCREGDGYVLSSRSAYIPWWPTEPERYWLNITRLDTVGQTVWQRQFDVDEGAYAFGDVLTQTSDGGFLAATHISQSWGQRDILLIKVDGQGNLVSLAPERRDSSVRLNVYPVPAGREINIDLPEDKEGTVKEIAVIGLSGMLIMRLDMPDGSRRIRLDTGSWAEEVYFYSARLHDGRVAYGSFGIFR